MAIHPRILGLALGLLLVLAAAVDLVDSRWFRPAVLALERVNTAGPASPDPQTGGIVITLTTTAISVEFPSCDLGGYLPQFFLHVYPDRTTSALVRPFVNRDFDVRRLAPQRVQSTLGERCVYSQPYGNVPAREIIVGQYIAPQDRCCTALWARDYVVPDR